MLHSLQEWSLKEWRKKSSNLQAPLAKIRNIWNYVIDISISAYCIGFAKSVNQSSLNHQSMCASMCIAWMYHGFYDGDLSSVLIFTRLVWFTRCRWSVGPYYTDYRAWPITWIDNTVKRMVLDDRLKRADSQTVFKRKDLQLDRERGMVSTKQMDTISLFGKYSTWLWYRSPNYVCAARSRSHTKRLHQHWAHLRLPLDEHSNNHYWTPCTAGHQDLGEGNTGHSHKRLQRVAEYHSISFFTYASKEDDYGPNKVHD